MSAPAPGASPVLVAVSSDRSNTVTVRATEAGLPVDIRFERSRYRYGAQDLAEEILRLTRRSALVAKSHRREMSAEAGLPEPILDRLGLPSPRAAAAELDRIDEIGRRGNG